MSVQSILLPLFVEVALILLVVLVAIARPERRDGAVPAAVPGGLELPLLFFVLTGLALATRAADVTFVVLAWVFVVLQVAAAVGRVASADDRLQRLLVLGAALVLALAWAAFALRILFATVLG